MVWQEHIVLTPPPHFPPDGHTATLILGIKNSNVCRSPQNEYRHHWQETGLQRATLAEDITHSKLCDTHPQLLIRQKMPEAQKNMPSRNSQIGRWICIREFGIQVALNTLVSEQSPSFAI